MIKVSTFKIPIPRAPASVSTPGGLVAARQVVRRLSMVGATLTMAVLAIIFAPSAAQAHDPSPCIYNPGGARLTCGGVKSNHTVAWNCDWYADNQGTRTWYENEYGRWDYVSDGNGSRSGCGQEHVSASGGSRIVRYQVCMGPIESERCLISLPA